jgi:hypothetical protein
MEVGQGPNVGCSAKGKKNIIERRMPTSYSFSIFKMVGLWGIVFCDIT